VDSGLKPVDLYDIARMCAQSYRGNPSVSGWRIVSPAEMRLTEARLIGVPYFNRRALAWYRPALAGRRAMLAMIIRPHGVMEMHPDAPAPDAIETVTPIITAALAWAGRNSVADVVLAGHDDGARIACEAVAGVRTGTISLSVVAFGAGDMIGTGRSVPLLEVVREVSESGSLGRPDEYLHDIRVLYETGDLADMLRDSDTHTVIRIPASARQ
jgi:hypothetical protein